MRQIAQEKHSIELTLCPSCVRQFYNTRNFYVCRVNQYQQERDKCSYCGIRSGWDYIVSTMPAKRHTFPNFRKDKTVQIGGIKIMEQFHLNNTTYLIRRVFSGTKTASELVGEHLRASSCQALPLTAPSPISYNTNGNPSAVRSSE